MKNDQIITINGRQYYKDTGLPVKKSSTVALKTAKTSAPTIKAIHSVATRTKSLYSNTAMRSSGSVKTTARKIGRSMDIARSKSISHFAPRTANKTATKPSKHVDQKPIKHPIAAKVARKQVDKKTLQAKTTASKPAKIIKEEAIKEAMSKAAEKEPPKKKSFVKQHLKYLNIMTVGVLLLIAVGYFVYLNLPNISVTIASAQAGINATYPEYVPDGYSSSGPVSFSKGEVIIKFHANTGKTSFMIKQSKSSWDSSAVKLQVDKESPGDTTETKEGGRTIYTYDNNTKAAWVNGGILYTISGDAKLSGEQVRNIATSL